MHPHISDMRRTPRRLDDQMIRRAFLLQPEHRDYACGYGRRADTVARMVPD
jgi:hypothetical protein